MGWSYIHLLASIICWFTISSCAVRPTTILPPVLEHARVELIGGKACTFGPSYWCQNFSTSKECSATKHCIQTVWEHQVLPADHSNVCQICKDMVKQARDQLESNETQELLKEVFEGSCNLIPLKEISKECCKIADEFIPELIEALSSQMNPQVVCSVAGLCNSVRIQKLLEKPKTSTVEQVEVSSTVVHTPLNCDNCYLIAEMMLNNFQAAEKDDIMEKMIEFCGRAGSFSDGCAALVITYFNSIYTTMNEQFQPNRFCHLAGVCSGKFHVHEDRVSPVTEVISKPVGDDITCDLCMQLVKHLQDILIANTTRIEFKQVLMGICGQMREFKEECKQIVEEYYVIIYDFLLTELDGKGICTQIGLCKAKRLLGSMNEKLPLRPLLPVEVAEKLKETKEEAEGTKEEEPRLHRVKLIGTGVSVHGIPPSQAPELLQLPVERMMPQSIIPQNKEMCQMCELFLHYMQVEITNPESEKEIKDFVKRACVNLPQSVRGQCDSFVDIYGDAFIAIVAQKIDPSQVCPSIGVCPGIYQLSGEKPNCPLCLMAAGFLIEEIKDNKTEEAVRHALDMICVKMPAKLKEDCLEFVTKFSEDVIDMVTADFTPEEICVFAKLCDPPPHAPHLEESSTSMFRIGNTGSESSESSESIEETDHNGGNIFTNEIPQSPPLRVNQVNCEICKMILREIEHRLSDNATVEEIKTAVESVCQIVPRRDKQKCEKFIDKYADTIIELLATTKPSLVCTVMKLCGWGDYSDTDILKKSVSRCVVCESLMGALQGILQDDTVDGKINDKLEAACRQLPQSMGSVCEGLVEQLAPQIENIITEIPVGPIVCRKFNICAGRKQNVHLIGREACTWGPSFWCSSTTNAAACGAIEHCQENYWKADKPQNKKKNY